MPYFKNIFYWFMFVKLILFDSFIYSCNRIVTSLK